jgi:uncharacterized protein YodC (DUF2158 family)
VRHWDSDMMRVESGSFMSGDNKKMAQTLKVGDVVRLRSGGRPMTIGFINTETKRVSCQWFSENKSQEGLFYLEALELDEKK